jgi:hypothetical protein
MADNEEEPTTAMTEGHVSPGGDESRAGSENGSVAEVVNANGLTAEQQAEYEAYYTLREQYHPDQPIPKASRKFGLVQEDNPFLVSEASDGWNEDLSLGQINLQCEYNHAVPQGTTTSRKEQQKLFHSNPTQSVTLVTHLSKLVLKKLKSETGHLLETIFFGPARFRWSLRPAKSNYNSYFLRIEDLV